MSTAMEQRHAADLQELTQLGMEIARELHGRVVAADTREDAERMSRAFERVSRSVRQCMALEARLFRDARRLEREVRDEGRADAARHREARKAQVKAAVDRLIWTEAERPERLDTIFEYLLDEAASEPCFMDGAVETQIARLAACLGLPARPIAGPAVLTPGDPPDFPHPANSS